MSKKERAYRFLTKALMNSIEPIVRYHKGSSTIPRDFHDRLTNRQADVLNAIKRIEEMEDDEWVGLRLDEQFRIVIVKN